MTTAFYKPESYLLPRTRENTIETSNNYDYFKNQRASREISPNQYLSPLGNNAHVDIRNFSSVDMTNIHNQDFSYKKILKQKVFEQPKPRYIRDNMSVADINQGMGMGTWDTPQGKSSE